MNTVTIEGVIRHMWEYDRNRFLRLSVRRELARLPKRVDLDRQGRVMERRCDYITVRLQDGLESLPVQKGQAIRVTGYIQSRDYPVTLKDFLRKADGPYLPLPDQYDPDRLIEGRSTTEIVAQEVQFVGFRTRPAVPANVDAQPVEFAMTEAAA